MDDVICSAKGCRARARHALVWNNPKVHTPDREKIWVACDEHRTSLSEFLDMRSFLIRVDPLRVRCPECDAPFPAEQQTCPVCGGSRGDAGSADGRSGGCGSLD